MQLEAEIDRLYGLPLDEFVAERGALAKRLRGEDRAAADRVKALRKPTAGAWALNQAVRRRRSETEALIAAGERLRSAHATMVSGKGGREQLRDAMAEERSLAAVLADCAETIASETGKSGPALRERVRTTVHAAALDDEVRDELSAGRLVREREAVGLGSLEGAPAKPRRRGRAPKSNDGKRKSEIAAAQKRLAKAREAADAARDKVAAAERDQRTKEERVRELERELARLEKGR